MSQLKMTDDGDIEIGMNKFSLVTGRAEIRQRLIQALRTFFGEDFTDLTKGLPWFQVVFEKTTPPEQIDAAIKNEILSVTGVISLTRYEPLDLDVATRTLAVDFEVNTVFGAIAIEEELP